MTLTTITAIKNPTAMILVQRSKNASIERDLCFVRNVSFVEPVRAPSERSCPSWNKTTRVTATAKMIKIIPKIISNVLI